MNNGDKLTLRFMAVNSRCEPDEQVRYDSPCPGHLGCHKVLRESGDPAWVATAELTELA